MKKNKKQKKTDIWSLGKWVSPMTFTRTFFDMAYIEVSLPQQTTKTKTVQIFLFYSKNISVERKIITKCYIKYFVHNF